MLQGNLDEGLGVCGAQAVLGAVAPLLKRLGFVIFTVLGIE